MKTNTNNQTWYEKHQFDSQNFYNQENQKQYIDNYQKNNNNHFFNDVNSIGKWTISFIRIYFLSVFFLIIGIVLWVEGLGYMYIRHNNNTMRIAGIILTTIGLLFVFINFIYSIIFIVTLNNLKEINKVFISPMILFTIGLVFYPFALIAAYMNVSIVNRTLT